MLFRKTERKRLMHKDTVVLTGDYDPRRHGFVKVSKLIEPAHLPPGVLFSATSVDLNTLNNWLLWRGIPHYRVDLEKLKKRLNIADEKDLLEEEYALSVSDQYWLCPVGQSVTWSSVNFFQRSFDGNEFAKAVFRRSPYSAKESAIHTPNNTLCGFHRKAWVKENGTICLYKGSTGFNQQECINEWLASVIADCLSIYCVPYEVKKYEGQIVSVCPNFINPDLDLVTAGDAVLSSGEAGDATAEQFLAVMEAHGITDARRSLEEMYLLDYLMMNTDRHSQNAGVLLDAETNQWICMAPIFDTGTGLGCFTGSSQLDALEYEKNCRVFSEKHLSFDSLLARITDWKRYDFSALDTIPDRFRNVLFNYRSVTGISDSRIEALVKLLNRRIENVRQYQLHHPYQ